MRIRNPASAHLKKTQKCTRGKKIIRDGLDCLVLLVGQHGAGRGPAQAGQHGAGKQVARNEEEEGAVHEQVLQGGEEEKEEGGLVVHHTIIRRQACHIENSTTTDNGW